MLPSPLYGIFLYKKPSYKKVSLERQKIKKKSKKQGRLRYKDPYEIRNFLRVETDFWDKIKLFRRKTSYFNYKTNEIVRK